MRTTGKNNPIRETNSRHRLVYTLFLWFLLVGTVPLGLSAFKYVSFNKSWLETNLRVLQLESARSLSGEIDYYLDSCRRDILLLSKLLAGNESQAALQGQIHSERFDDFLKELVSRGRLSQIHIVNPEGQGVTTQVGPTQPRDNLFLREGLENTLLRRDLMILGSSLQERSGVHQLIVSKRIENTDQVLGAVLGLVNLEPLARKIQGLSLNSEIMVVDRAARLVFSNRSGSTGFREPDVIAELGDLRGQVKNILYTSSEDQTRKIATLLPMMGDLGWSVIVQADEATTYYPVEQLISSTMFWFALAVLLSGAVGMIVSRRISEPVSQLVSSSASLAAGNFKERVEIKSQNEIGELGEHFNTMADKIEGYVEELRASAHSNRQLFLEAVQTISAAIDEKDPYTKGHSERVTRYAVAVAEELELSREEVENVRVAALLHDVGKIGVPDEILQKPDKLNPQEFEIMKQHTIKGARLIGQISQLRDVVPGILYHHEMVNGSGYPEGLQGSHIPLQARIIAVVDAFDALTTRRPYQVEMDIGQAIDRLETFIGSRYHAQVIEALKLAVSNGKIVVQKPRRASVTSRSFKAPVI
ncbi:MAG: HD domain-containing phosphohydrolase [Acidobacteriota bacterium]